MNNSPIRPETFSNPRSIGGVDVRMILAQRAQLDKAMANILKNGLMNIHAERLIEDKEEVDEKTLKELIRFTTLFESMVEHDEIPTARGMCLVIIDFAERHDLNLSAIHRLLARIIIHRDPDVYTQDPDSSDLKRLLDELFEENVLPPAKNPVKKKLQKR